jgi:hypothetical protein
MAYNWCLFPIMVSPWRRSSGIATCRRYHIIKQNGGLLQCTLSPVSSLLTVEIHGLTWMFIYNLDPLAKLREVKITSSCLSVHLSVLRYQLGSHFTDFLEIWHWGLLLKSVEKIFFLIGQKYHEYLIKQDNILLNSSYTKKGCHAIVAEKIRTLFMLKKFVENIAV